MGFWRGVANFVTFGAIDRIEANDIEEKARNREENARKKLEIQKEKTQTSLMELGFVKQDAFANSLQQFIYLYQNIGKVDLSPIKNLEGTVDYRQFKIEYAEMKKISTSFKQLALVSGGGIIAGAAVVGGAMGLAVLVGTASTGVAIGSLSGVAATNATLAWLGGGALSAGGAGATGGMLVLGGIALAPLALLGMFLGSSSGKQRLNSAQNYSDEIDVLVERVNTLIVELQKIERGANLFRKTIFSLEKLMIYQNQKMETIVTRLNNRGLLSKCLIDPVKKIFNLKVLTDEEAIIFSDGANCAYLLKQLIDTPLLTGEGAFMEDAMNLLKKRRNESNALLQQASMPQFSMEQ